MKAKKLIKKLKKIIKKHGNLHVRYDGYTESNQDIRGVIAYDEDGNTDKKRVEIFLH